MITPELTKKMMRGEEVPVRPEWREIGAGSFGGDGNAEKVRAFEDAPGGKIPFSTDWNRKLQCDAFTTFRIFNPRKYRRGLIYQILLKGNELGRARLVDLLTVRWSEINPTISFIDTGYDEETFRKILQQMYKASIQDFAHSMWNLLILKWEERHAANG